MPPRKSSAAAAATAAADRLTANLSTDRAEPFKSLDPRMNEVVPPPALANLANYKYSTIDESIVQKYCGILTFWTLCAQQVPYWVAPNMLTLQALFFSMSYPLLIIAYEYRGLAIPDWVWLYSAFALFAYQTLDAIDGKHARRTGAKSALGELFDHGCDALFAPFCLYASGRAVALANNQLFVFGLVSSFGLYLTIFLHFMSGSLTMGPINGPTEGILINVAVFVATYALGGQSFWQAKLADKIAVDIPASFVSACRGYVRPSYVLAETRSDIFFAVLIAAAAGTALTVGRQAYLLLSPKRTDAMVSFAVNTAAVGIWALFAALHPETAYAHAGKWSIVLGSYFAFTASRLTVHRLCQLPAANPFGILAISLFLPVLKLLLRDHVSVDSFAAPMAALVTLMYAHYLVSVWHQFARGLGVNVVTLTKKQIAASFAAQEERRKNGEK